MKKARIDFKRRNVLIPVVIQDYQDKNVLMVGYMNELAWQKTLKEGFVYFWSRSRKKLWLKGKESGNKLKVKKIFIDCDYDTILVQAKLIGKNVCHKGFKSCFHQRIL